MGLVSLQAEVGQATLDFGGKMPEVEVKSDKSGAKVSSRMHESDGVDCGHEIGRRQIRTR